MFVQLQRILFPTDFSDRAKQAQQYAIALAEQFDCELHVLHVIPPVTFPLPEASTSWSLPAADQKILIEHAQSQLLEQIDIEWAKAHRVVEVAKAGNAVDEIVKYATDHDIDLIVLGTHGHTGFARLLLGSVAEKIVRLATCPVLTVHPKGHQFVSDAATDQSASLPMSSGR